MALRNWLVPLAFGFSVFGCGSDASDSPAAAEPTGDDLGWTGGKADGFGTGPAPVQFVDEAPQPGETLTQARARALTKYGEDLLKAWDPVLEDVFEKRGVKGEPVSSYMFDVEGGSCFNEESRWGSDFDIKTDEDVERMVKNVNYAVEFIARFHRDANGYANRFFDTVSLCPSAVLDSPLKLQGKVLHIGVDYAWGKVQVQDAFALREHWSSGEHLVGDLEVLSRLWSVLDPVGGPRTMLRDGVANAGQFLAKRLRDARDKSENVLRADLKEMVTDNALGQFETPQEECTSDPCPAYRQTALARIQEMDAPQLQQVADLWSEFLSDSTHWEGMTEAVLVTHEATARKAYDLDIHQTGLVVVGNFHDINVDVSAFLPGNSQFVRYVTMERLENNIKVRQLALVAVYTIDNVDVNLSIGAQRGIETAGLKYALDRVNSAQ